MCNLPSRHIITRGRGSRLPDRVPDRINGLTGFKEGLTPDTEGSQRILQVYASILRASLDRVRVQMGQSFD